MRKLILLIIIASTTSCSVFISKDLRKKNRANRQLKRVLKRNPNLKTVDTLYVEIPKVEIDTFINLKIDTLKLDSIVYLIKDTAVRNVIKKYITNEVYSKDTINQFVDGFNFSFWFSGGNLNYTVEKPLEVLKKEIEVIRTIKLTLIEQITNTISKWFWKIILLLAFLVGIRLVYKFFF